MEWKGNRALSHKSGWIIGPILALPLAILFASPVHAQEDLSPERKAAIERWRAKVRAARLVKAAKKPVEKSTDPVPAAASPTFQISLRDLGFKDGLVAEDSQYTQTIFFPVPRDVPFTKANLKLLFKSSELLSPPSNFRVSVNGVPRAVIPLQAKDNPGPEINVPIDLKWLDKSYLEVKIQAALIVSGNFCVDEAAKGGYLNVLAESALQLGLKSSEPATIRAYWQLLPPKVTISLSDRVDEEAFFAAWMLGATLRRFGKEVAFDRLPNLGDIVIAPSESIDRLAAQQKQSMGNVLLLSRKDRTMLAVREPYHVGQITALDKPWIELASGSDYLFRPPTGFKASGKGVILPVKLSDLGITDSLRVFRASAEWAFYQRPRQIAPRHIPRQLFLNVVSTPSEADKPISLYVYANSRLVEVVRLADHGKPQQFTISLPSEELRSDNRFRVVAQRVDPQGNCDKGGMYGTYSIQLLPDSALLTEQHDTPPERLSQLVSYFGDDFKTYLPSSFLHRPERPLNLLSRLATDLSISISDASKIRFYTPSETLEFKSAFFLVGKPAGFQVKSPVRFDQGSVQVTETNGRVLLDVDRLPGVTIAQVARAGDYRGLWITTAEADEPPATESIATSDGDLLFLDPSGALLSLDSRKTEAARVVQRGATRWFDLLGAYRYWLLAAGWIMGTVLFVQLYRKVQKHRMAS